MKTLIGKVLGKRTPARGMTLIEIMVVVFILGLIATVVAVNVGGAADDARIETAKLDIKGFQSALDLYKLKRGRYPNGSEGLPVLFSEKLLKGSLKKDPWGKDYVYVQEGTGYKIMSYGPDGNSGGGDDVTSE